VKVPKVSIFNILIN